MQSIIQALFQAASTCEEAQRYSSASQKGLNKNTMRSTNESSGNLRDASTTMLEDSMIGTLKKRTGRTVRGISTKSPEPNMQKITGAVGRDCASRSFFGMVHEYPGHRLQRASPHEIRRRGRSCRVGGSLWAVGKSLVCCCTLGMKTTIIDFEFRGT